MGEWRRSPWTAVVLLGLGLAAWGYHLDGVRVMGDWLFWAQGRSGPQVGQQCQAFYMMDTREAPPDWHHCYF